MRKIFGTDGARGIANIELTPDLAMRIGVALGYKIGSAGNVLIGEDTRVSSPMLRCAVASGLASAGVNVSLAFVLPTPAISLLTREKQFSAGVVVSASHNPIEFNGIKIFGNSGLKLEDSEEEEIERLIELEDRKWLASRHIGRIESEEHLKEYYIDRILQWFPLDLSSFKVAVDSAFGATYYTTPETLTRLKATVFASGNSPDGERINVHCGSTHPQVITELVKKSHVNIGISHDGDGDRVIFCDENANVVDGDETMLIIGKHLKAKGKLRNDTVVGTVMTNMGVEKGFTEAGIRFLRTKVGDRYVVSEMIRSGAVLGGEQSGHIIYMERSCTGDGLITALLLLQVMFEENKPLSELRKGIERFPQILVNVRVKDKSVANNEGFVDLVKKEEEALKGRGRILVRPSGTEPLIRIMVEGENEVEINRVAERLKEYLEV